MAAIPIVDAHVHLYDPKDGILDWIRNAPKLNGRHLSEDYKEATAGLDISEMVFVEVDAAAGKHFREIEWLSDYAKNEPRLKAMVGSFPMETGTAVEQEIERYAQFPLARGVRRLIQGHVNEPGWCLKPDFIAAVKLLPKYNLSFDICIFHPQMADAIALVKQCPEVRFVLDHIGKPGIAAGLREPWTRQIRELAGLPNVWCKISGVITEADHAKWTVDQVTPYIDEAIDAFGFNRVMFGSDWPVINLASDYRRWVQIAGEAVSRASESEQRRFWRDTAKEFYRF